MPDQISRRAWRKSIDKFAMFVLAESTRMCGKRMLSSRPRRSRYKWKTVCAQCAEAMK
jgi:hypothetical protein